MAIPQYLQIGANTFWRSRPWSSFDGWRLSKCSVFQRVPGLVEATALLGVPEDADPALAVSACELILEGLHVQQKIDRSEQRGYMGTPKVERKTPRDEPSPPPSGGRRRHFN